MAGRNGKQTKLGNRYAIGRILQLVRQGHRDGSSHEAPTILHVLASSIMISTLSRTFLFLLVCSMGVVASAQTGGRALIDEKPPAEESSSWYGESSPQQLTPRMIIQQKAQMRAYQRMARIESMKWYGMSASRPLSNAVPFSGVPSPRYEMPGGRPFSWYPARTNVVIVR